MWLKKKFLVICSKFSLPILSELGSFLMFSANHAWNISLDYFSVIIQFYKFLFFSFGPWWNTNVSLEDCCLKTIILPQLIACSGWQWPCFSKDIDIALTVSFGYNSINAFHLIMIFWCFFFRYVLFLLFGLAQLPFVYAISYLISNPTIGVMAISVSYNEVKKANTR